jgi:hypothetical protein
MERIHPSSSFSKKVNQSSMDSRLTKMSDAIRIGDDDDDGRMSVEQIRLMTKDFFTNTFIGMTYNSLLLLLSIVSCFEYIAQTYFSTADTLPFMELLLAVVFTWDWCVNCFIAEHKSLFFTR